MIHILYYIIRFLLMCVALIGVYILRGSYNGKPDTTKDELIIVIIVTLIIVIAIHIKWFFDGRLFVS